MEGLHRIVAGLAAGLVLLGAGACGHSANDAGTGAPNVTVQAVRTQTLRDVVNTAGAVVPALTTDWTIWAPEPASILEVTKHEGDPVALGDVLVRFDMATVSQQMAAQQAEMDAAEARVSRAKAEVERQASLNERGLTPRNTFEASRAEEVAAEAELARAISALEAAKSQDDRSVIKARFNGVVVKTWHGPGDFVNAGSTDPIMRVVDPTRVQVAAQVPLATLARVSPGQTVQVTSSVGGPSEPTTVLMKTDPTDPAAQTAELRLAFAAPTSLTIDTPVTLEIVLDQRTGALVVPAAAIGRDAGGSFVMVAGDDGRAHRRDIRRGLATGDLVQITAGVVAGENVIVGGLSEVGDESPITIVAQ